MSKEDKSLTEEEFKKLVEDSGKLARYIQSCKDAIQEQTKQLQAQQEKYKATISNLESQQCNSKFHAVALKIQLELQKLFNIFKKKYQIKTGLYFRKYRQQVARMKESDIILSHQQAMHIQSSLTRLVKAVRINRSAVTLKYFKAWQAAVPDEQKVYEKKLARLDKKNKVLSETLNKLKSSETKSSSIQELKAENKRLVAKIEQAELSVGMFVQQMASLLDQHEPAAIHDELEEDIRSPPKKRTKSKKRSPERIEPSSVKKSVERKGRVQFD